MSLARPVFLVKARTVNCWKEQTWFSFWRTD